jgi:hypothetical protein
MRIYNSFEEIDFDVKRLNLERKIAWEKIKHSSNEVQESLSPYNWIQTILSSIKKFGILLLLKKIFNK